MQKLSFVSTVVGSFPRKNTIENMKLSFNDEISAGIDFPCYPQLVSMIDQFLKPLSNDPNSGLIFEQGKYILQSDLKIPSKIPAETIEYGKFVLNFFKENPTIRNKIKGWKACLTGPFTLASEIHIPENLTRGKRSIVFKEPRAIMVKSIVEKLAKYMSEIAKEYDSMGASIISMDEPILGLIIGKQKIFFYERDEIIDILNIAIRLISKYSSIHVCGTISKSLVDILMQTNVKILDHEFTNGLNSGIFNKSQLSESDKSLAYGVIESNVKFIEKAKIDDYVEPISLIESRIIKAVDDIGKESLIFKPDCGFGGLLKTFGEEIGSEIVKRKLTNLCIAIKNLKNKL